MLVFCRGVMYTSGLGFGSWLRVVQLGRLTKCPGNAAVYRRRRELPRRPLILLAMVEAW